MRAAGVGIAVLTFLAAAVGYNVAYVASEQVQTCTVTEKDRTTKYSKDGSSTDARVWTEECGVLSVNDDLTSLSFNSADRYGKLKVGQSYELTTRGWRVPFFSSFPNVIEATEVGK